MEWRPDAIYFYQGYQKRLLSSSPVHNSYQEPGISREYHRWKEELLPFRTQSHSISKYSRLSEGYTVPPRRSDLSTSKPRKLVPNLQNRLFANQKQKLLSCLCRVVRLSMLHKLFQTRPSVSKVGIPLAKVTMQKCIQGKELTLDERSAGPPERLLRKRLVTTS